MSDNTMSDNATSADGLGPLPDYAHAFPPRWFGDQGGFTAQQMLLYARQAVAAERERWERALGAEMPADFKSWHQNAASERPEVAAWVIRNLREREALAWSEGPNQRCSSLIGAVSERDAAQKG